MEHSRTVYLTRLALLAAVELLLAYTPLGYLKTFGLEISFLMIPVVIGAVMLGPLAGAVLGSLFGLTSFATCFGASTFGAALLSISPGATFLTCFGSRAAAGWLCGVFFQKLMRLSQRENLAISTASLVGPLLNTAFFMGSLVCFFYRTPLVQELVTKLGAGGPLSFIIGFVGVQGAVEAVVGFIVSGAVCRVLFRNAKKTAV